MSLAKEVVIAIAAGFLVLGGISYCTYSMYTTMKADMPQVESEAHKWVANFNSDQFEQCYQEADPKLTDAFPESGFVQQMKNLKAQLGAITMGARTSYNLTTFNGDVKVVAKWDVTSAKGKKTAIFALHKLDKWKVMEFQIDPLP